MKLHETLDLIAPSVRSQGRYHLKLREVPVKLNQNENPFDWPLPIKEAVGKFCVERPWNRYPPFIPEELTKLLADYIEVSPDCVIAGNGSNEMLLVLMLAVSRANRPIILCQPTFTVHKLLAEGVGAGAEIVHLDEELRFDLSRILGTIDRLPHSPLLICSPNNPTGTTVSEDEIRTILERHRGFLILDQAYVEFGGFSAAPLIREYPNLIVTRTFSKAFAGAGLRIGYMAGAPEVMREINKIKLPYNINFFSEHVARTALLHRRVLAEGIATIIRERDSVAAAFSRLPLKVYPSAANFILIRTERKQQLFDSLLDDGILIRDVSSYPMLDNCLRVSIGTPEENRSLLRSMERFFTAPVDSAGLQTKRSTCA